MNTRQPVILVADDHAGIREVIDTLLSMEGYRVLQAANGLEVFEMIATHVPDLILLDLSMPRLDGWQVMKLIRDQRIHIPVIIIAATTHAAEHAAEVGADGALTKPFEAAELKRTVRQVLRTARGG